MRATPKQTMSSCNGFVDCFCDTIDTQDLLVRLQVLQHTPFFSYQLYLVTSITLVPADSVTVIFTMAKKTQGSKKAQIETSLVSSNLPSTAVVIFINVSH